MALSIRSASLVIARNLHHLPFRFALLHPLLPKFYPVAIARP